jgi:alkylation response protein AidB-like acyl-CoA dehydrogenase
MSYTYVPPLADMRFVIERVLEAPAAWARCAAFADVDIDTVAAVLEEGGRFASEVLQPLNAKGDAEGCRVTAEGVTTPAGFRAAYQAFVEGGWPALPCSPDWGGQGLPLLLDAALREMLSACNHGWNMYPDLLHGAYETIKGHASDELKSRYLEDVATGRTLAAMALTEPQAGSDLGMLTTKASVQPDGSLRISGSKIFISGADHDLAEQIVHLVLCRLQDLDNPAPPGTKGISLALVPKVLPDGTRNAWQVDSVEHKMGIHGSATCALRYEGATGWLVGEPNRGLAAMFLMMNSVRLHVGLQGLGHQEMATQNAVRYAAEREQFGGSIDRYPAMRRTLERLQAMTEAQRVIMYRAALALDNAAHHEDVALRERERAIAALLTPVVKAFGTEHGFQSASAALQVYGGYGYVREYGIEQTLRDSRIAMIYEGTNEIQAIDLVQRKLLADGGAALELLLAELEAEAERAAGPFREALEKAIAEARGGMAALQVLAGVDREGPLHVADDALAGFAHTLLVWAWAARARAAGDDATAVERCRWAVAHFAAKGSLHWGRVVA